MTNYQMMNSDDELSDELLNEKTSFAWLFVIDHVNNQWK